MLYNFFTNPWMLAALGAVLIPPIIEWLFRRRKRQVELPTLRYLLRNKEQEKIKRQDRILLILRMVGIGLLVFSIARPMIQHGQTTEGRERHVMIVVDNTASMNQQVGVTTSFGLAQKKASGMVRGLPDGTRVSVAMVGERIDFPVENVKDNYTAADKISSLRPGSGASSMTQGIQLVDQYLKGLEDDKRGEPEIYIFSDFQKYTWTDDTQGTNTALNELTQKYETYMVDVGGDPKFNYVVSDLRPVEMVLSAGMEVQFNALIETIGAPPEDQKCAVSFLVEGSERDKKLEARMEKKGIEEVTLGENDKKVVSFKHLFAKAGEYVVEVSVEGDEHVIDNRRQYICSVPENVRVLVLDETAELPPAQRETIFLERAISPPARPGMGKVSRFLANVQHPRQIAYENLDSYAAVILAGTDQLEESSVAKLQNYVEDGGAAWFFMGTKIQSLYKYNKLLYKEGKGLLPCKLKDKVNVPAPAGNPSEKVYLNLTKATHPGVTGELRTSAGAEDGPYTSYVDFEDIIPEAKVVTQLSNDVRATLEREFGRGRVFVSNSSPGVDWNYLPATYEYVIMMQELLRYLVGNPDGRVNLNVGDKFTSPVFISSQHLLLRYPDGAKAPRITPEKRPGRENEYFMTFDRTFQQGVYELDAPEEVVPRRRFVVNMNAQEGNLARLDSSEFKGAFGGSSWSWIGPEKPIEDFVANLHTVTELAAIFLWALVICLAAESFLAARFGKRRGGNA